MASSWCGSDSAPFGPVDTTVNWPDLTPCFQLTVLQTGLTNGLLILVGVPVLLRQLFLSPASSPSSSPVLIAKTTLCVALVITSLVDVVLVAPTPTVAAIDSPAELTASITTLIAFVIATALHVVTHNAVPLRGDTLLLLFWLARGLVAVLALRSWSHLHVWSSSSSDGLERYVLLVLQVAMMLAVLVLEALPKPRPVYKRLKPPSSSNADATDFSPIDDDDDDDDDKDEDEEELCPEDIANVFSRFSFWWLNKLVAIGHKGTALRLDDVFSVPHFLRARQCAGNFSTALAARLANPARAALSMKHNMLAVIWAVAGTQFVALVGLKVATDLLPFLQPQLLSLLLAYLEQDDASANSERGYLLAVAMFLVSLLQSLATQQYFHECFRLGVRVRTSLVTAIYSKAMLLSSAAKQQSTTGQITNLMSLDAQRLMDFASFAHNLWASPLTVAISLVFLYNELGAATFVGLATLIVLLPLDTFISRNIKTTQKSHMGGKDTRMKLLDELVTAIKVIKLSAWEPAYKTRIADARSNEMSTLTVIFWRTALQAVLWSGMPVLMTIASLGSYVFISGEPLTPTKAFVSLSLFSLLQAPLTTFPTTIISAIDAYVALGRLAAFFESEELQADAVTRLPPSSSANVFAFRLDGDAEFTWTKGVSDGFILGPINLVCSAGSLTAVLGPVGGGKSMLMLSLLGDVHRLKGCVMMRGRVAYVPQQAWIMNATLKENILFGLPLDEQRYHSVLEACDLQRDLDILPAGDDTEIGERGVNLSGGQCQRVSLARAAYSQADVYLLDDPLSAVDRQVALHIFTRLIGPSGLLGGATRVLVTHRLENLDLCNNIVCLRSGKIVENGSYEELRSKPDGVFATLMDTYTTTSTTTAATSTEDAVSSSSAALVTTKTTQKKGGKTVEQESRVTGEVDTNVYASYAKSVGATRVALLFAVMLAVQVAAIGSTLWLQKWSSAGQDGVDRVGLYLGVYAGLGIAQVVFVGAQAVVASVFCGLHASATIYNHMFNQVLHARMSFFETTTLGRILNRFSKDVDTIDLNLPRALSGYLRQLFIVLGCFVAIVYAIPFFAPVIPVVSIFYWYMMNYFKPIKRDLKRLDSILRSPTIAHFAETLQGLVTVRAYGQQGRFVTANRDLVDKQLRAYYYSITSNRWQGIRVDMLGSIVMFASAVIVVATVSPGNAALGGVVITYALQMTGALNTLVRTSSETETHIVAVERVREYDSLPLEGPSVVENNRPPAAWPHEGAVTFVDYSTRYREGLDLVLRDINLSIRPREKVGVVGRTGSGKSTMLTAIPRLLEAASGKIVIDGIDISQIGLADLRPKIAVITQNPTLLTGTLRENLDPIGQHDDDKIWRVLECAQLDVLIRAFPEGLAFKVAQQGNNLSLGQRQLLCLARALLSNARILLMDEATAAVDVETDERIQKTIRTEFKDCTVITIAHRLNTVLDSDRIVVLSDGLIAEVDTPEALMARPDSLFSNLLRQ